MPGNRLITRGMGTSTGTYGRAGMVSQGMGGLFQFVAKQVTRIIKAGQSGTKRALRDLEEIIVGAKLVRVNDDRPKQVIQGHITVKVNVARHIAVMAEGVSKRVRAAWEDVKITVKRIR